jgi:hypothetical protein
VKHLGPPHSFIQHSEHCYLNPWLAMVFNGQSTGTGDQVGEEHGETRGTDYFRSPNTGIHAAARAVCKHGKTTSMPEC